MRLTLQIPFGCSVINANISELRDMPGEDNKYFESLKAKAISAATQEARCGCSSAPSPMQGGCLPSTPEDLSRHWMRTSEVTL